MVKFVIEHLEPEVWEWCQIEYENISRMIGKENLIFTNLGEECYKLEKFGKCYGESVRDLKLERVCILDPAAEKVLSPEDEKEFDYFVFGGILGDYPPRQRTEVELTKFFPKAGKRHLGKGQFPTDNAVFLSNEILKGKRFEEFEFQDDVEIEINDVESVILPFRYVLVDGSRC
jgi:ribosome biogenesis SPOUT family RNA methylase Rps3